MKYEDFLERKSQLAGGSGFEPTYRPDFLFDFQSELVEWATRRGRAGIFADCGLGKTPMQLVWGRNVVENTNKPVLIVAPLAVSCQTTREGDKFDIPCTRSADGKTNGEIVITNYERLHYFDPDVFGGVVLDESSAIKHFSGARQKSVTQFMKKIPYRLLCTATAAPNDFIELGTAAEALGQMGRMDMLGTFFKNDENSLHPIWWGARWRFKAHAEEAFWRWVCSWARALRRPSDMGYDDDGFILPPLRTEEVVVDASRPLDGKLFIEPARTLAEQREERRITIQDRCKRVAEIVDTKTPAVVWCHLNAEGDMLEKIIPDAKQVSGSDKDEVKEERFMAFTDGELRVLITKPKIGGFGMNWQHCSLVTFFPSHSFEQYYQAVRRCWRFGQTRPVDVSVITTQGEIGVLKNLQRKAAQADKMFTNLVTNVQNELVIKRPNRNTKKVEVPLWV